MSEEENYDDDEYESEAFEVRHTKNHTDRRYHIMQRRAISEGNNDFENSRGTMGKRLRMRLEGCLRILTSTML